MSNKKYDISIQKQRERAFTFFTALLVIVSTVYSLYISQQADFFSINMVGNIYFTNELDGKKAYGVILLISSFKLLMVLGLLTTNNIMKKTMYALSCLMTANILGAFTFGSICPEMVNLGIYACQQTQLVDNKINILITLLLGFMCYKGYKKIETMEKDLLKMESV